MSIYNGGTIDNPKPRKPMQADSQKIYLHVLPHENNLSATDFNRKLNFALEVLKFFPGWENQIYADETNKEEVNQALNQYAPAETDEEGNTNPTFGEVLRSKTYGRLNGDGTGGLTNDIDFYDTAGDFDHINDDIDNEPDSPVETLIDEDLWAEVQDDLKTETRNYYEIMMEGIEDKSPEEAFHLMVGMLESRTRIISTLNDIFGSPDATDEEKINTFKSFLATYKDKIDNKKLGLLEFLLDTQQSFFSRIMPMFGETDQFYQSEIDKEQAAAFFEQLSEKIEEYINVSDFENLTDEQIESLPKDKQDAILLWDKWLNPENFIAPEQNVDPNETEWGKADYEQTKEFVDMITQENVAARVAARRELSEYKKKLEEWEEKKEEQQMEEINQLKLETKNRQDVKKREAVSRRKKLDEALALRQVKRENGSKNSVKYSSNQFRQLISRIAGRVREARGKTTSALVGNITPGKTMRFAKSTAVPAAAAKVESRGNAVVRSANKNKAQVVRASTSSKRTSILRAGSSSKPTRQARSTPSARTAQTKAYIKANIKSKAPKQNKD